MMRVRKAFAAETVHRELFGQPLDWGKTDCAQVVFRLCDECGLDRPKVKAYNSPGQAVRRLRSLGVDSLQGYMAAHYQEIKPSEALAGDVFGFPADDNRFGMSLGLVLNHVRGLAIHSVTGAWDHIDRAEAARLAAEAGTPVRAWRLV